MHEKHNDVEPQILAPHLPPLPRSRWALNRLTLGGLYDRVVVDHAHGRLWGVDNHLIRQLYTEDMGPAHLELGALSSGFLDHALDTRVEVEQVHLLDHDPSPLRVAERRVRRHGHTPTSHLCDPRITWPLEPASVDSVGSIMWTHTLPPARRDQVFVQAARALKPGGRFFGIAVVGQADPAALTRRAQRRRHLYNRVGLWSNLNDTARGYQHLLKYSFGPRSEVFTRVEGAGVFWEVVLR